MALVVAIGVATTMFVTAPLAPANAASVVHATPAAPAGAQTMTFHAKAPAATSGKISPFSTPLDLTCDLESLVPSAAGGHTNSIVIALGTITCTFDIDGSPAPVPVINLTNTLIYDGRTMDTQSHVANGVSLDSETTVSAPCLNGDWASATAVSVTFPIGYNPPSASGRNATSTTFNFGDCPNDYVEVPDVTDRDVSVAQRDLHEAELVGVVRRLTPSCDFPNFVIMDQSPNGGQLALRGSTVELTQSAGRPRNGNLCK
jgi:hypothetical protein